MSEIKDNILTTEEQKKLFDAWRHRICVKSYYEVPIEGKIRKIPMPIKYVGRKISQIYGMIGNMPEPTTVKEKRKLSKLSNKLEVKVAACILLNRLNLIPGLFNLYWRWLEWTKSEAYIAGVITCGYLPEKERFFFLNCASIKKHSEFLQMTIRME